MEPVKIGLLGMGTVGGGTVTVLTGNAQEIARRAGREICIAHAAAREYDPGTAAFLEHEFETYDLLREHLPVARTESRSSFGAGEASGAWVLTRYDDGCEVLRNPADFSSEIMRSHARAWIPQAIDPPMHTGYRRILNPWFTADAMPKLEPHLVQYAEELADDEDRPSVAEDVEAALDRTGAAFGVDGTHRSQP